MRNTLLDRFVYFVGFVTLATAIAALFIEFGPGQTAFGTQLPQVAWWAIAEPFMLCIVFLLVQGIGLRAIVPIPGSVNQDSWLVMLIVASIGPSTRLLSLAPKGAVFASREHLLVTMATITMCVIVRLVQLRRGVTTGAIAAGQ